MNDDAITLTACVSARDERGLQACLEALRPLTDEIIVAAHAPGAELSRIVRDGGGRLVTSPDPDDDAGGWNTAIDAARGHWILAVRPEERLVFSGYHAFREPLEDRMRWAFRLVRSWPSKHGVGTDRCRVLRLFRRHSAVRFAGLVHPRIGPALEAITGALDAATGDHPAELNAVVAPHASSSRGRAREIELIERQLKRTPDDPYYLFLRTLKAFGAYRFGAVRLDTLRRCWSIVTRDSHRGRTQPFAAEAAARYILELLYAGDETKACEVASRAATNRCQPASLRYALGRLAQLRGRLRVARYHFEAALAAANEVPDWPLLTGAADRLPMLALSEIRFSEGCDNEALRLYMEVSDRDDREPGNAFFGPSAPVVVRGEGLPSLKLLKNLAHARPESVIPWVRGSEILEAMGRRKESVQWLKIAVTRAPYRRDLVSRLEEAGLDFI